MMRPPMSSDESGDDYDGFSFGHEFDDKPKKASSSSQSEWYLNRQKEEDDFKKLNDILTNGDAVGLRKYLVERNGTEKKINYDIPLKDGWPLLFHAIRNVKYDMVQYLITNGANVNCQVDSVTPLMIICRHDSKNVPFDVNVLKITELLLKSGAVVNIRDKTGYTPLMFACTHGNEGIVKILIDVSALDATDNFGNTALIHAVENKHIEIVEMLLKAGADASIFNFAGSTPRQLAEFVGSNEIAELFTQEVKVDDIPLEYSLYKTYHDIAPTIFPEHERPPYSQDIPSILYGMRAADNCKQFYDAQISLPELLTMDDNHLKAIGIELEYQRKRILHGILKFHRHPFSPKSIQLVQKTKQKNMYQYYEMYAGYLKHLILMNATITYLLRIVEDKTVDEEIVQEIISSLDEIKENVHSLRNYVQNLSRYSLKNPLYIGPKESQNQGYKNFVSPILKYTIMLGVGLFFSYKLTKLLI